MLLSTGYDGAACRYGLYYGILSRDSAEVASDRIASMMGSGRKLAVSVRDCAICGGELQVRLSSGGARLPLEARVVGACSSSE